MIMASQVIIVEIVPVIARPPVENIAPSSGVSRVVPQVGQPAPRAISPVMMPAFSRLAEFCFFLFHKKTIRPISVPCRIDIAKIGNQSKNGWLTPNIAMKLCQNIWRQFGNPSAEMSSNLENPPDRRFISRLKNRKDGIKPRQKRFSLVASKIPLPAKANSSSHFLQFIRKL